MAKMLDLPNEVIVIIIEACLGPDLESLALTNKLLYHLADKALETHLMLKYYSVLRFGHSTKQGDWSAGGSLDHTQDSFHLLSDIIRDPRVADYPRTMYLADVVDDDRWIWDNVSEQEIDQEIITANESTGKIPFDALLDMIHDCGFIPENRKIGMFNGIQRGSSSSAAIKLLLTVLPNLTSVTVQGWTHGRSSEEIWSFVLKIAEANRDLDSYLHNKALAKLQSFTVCDRNTDSMEHMDELGPFAMLPSMRTLSAPKISSKYFDWPESFPFGSSCITVIDFTGASLDVQCLTQLLSGILALEKFKYSHHFWADQSPEYNVRKLVEALEPSSLNSLDISVENPEHLQPIEDEEECIESLTEFSSLEFIRIDADALHRRAQEYTFSYEDYIDIRRSSRIYEVVEIEDTDDEVQSNDENFHGNDRLIKWRSGLEALTEILPQTVKFLTLIHSSLTEEAMEDLLEGLEEEKDEYFPDLVRIDFEGATPLSEEAKAVLMETGVDFGEVERSK